MKKIICLVLSFLFVLTLFSCSKEAEPTEYDVIKSFFSDLSQKKFDSIASRSVKPDGSAVQAKDIESIYEYIVAAGADPSEGFTVKQTKKIVAVSATAKTANTYDIIAICGDKCVAFELTLEKRDSGYVFTQIYTFGTVSSDVTLAE